MSSAMTPVEPGTLRSKNEIGGGFTISKNLKSKNPITRLTHDTGTNRKVTKIPTTSSITTSLGSLDKVELRYTPTSQRLTAQIKIVVAKYIGQLKKLRIKTKAKPNKLPNVPGAKGISPRPKQVTRF